MAAKPSAVKQMVGSSRLTNLENISRVRNPKLGWPWTWRDWLALSQLSLGVAAILTAPVADSVGVLCL
jgi:hypothetical protein